jgi:membrane carboxypeptidase/penicillin-binding protein PbpC
MNESLSTAKDMGITTFNEPDRYGLALVLGGGEVKLVELAGAYTVFAQNGVKHPLRPILKIGDKNGKTIKEYKDENPAQVLDSGIAYEINNILSDNNARSLVFGTRTPLYFPDRTVAAKTGTTQEFRDAWTFGYTPERVTGVWVGNNNNTPMHSSADGSVVAAPIMHSFMDQVLAGKPDVPFTKPSNIQNVTLDKLSGKLPGTKSNDTRTDIATSWQVPKEKSNSAQKVKICTIDNKLATPDCPDSITKEVTYADVHSERPDYPNWENPVRAWAKANGVGGLPPTETTTLCSANQHPKISFSAPSEGSTVSGETLISTNVEAPLSVDRVEFYIDNLPIGIDNAAPYAVTYNMSNLAAGEHTILARVFDKASFSAEATIKVIVSEDILPPGNVGGVSVASGPGSITLSWTNPGDQDLSRVRVYFSTTNGALGNLFGTQVTASAGSHSSITIPGLTSGVTYYFTIRPVDSSGNENGSGTQYSGKPG